VANHSKADALAMAERLGWRSERNKKGYYKLVCPCGKHLKWLHNTPSDPNYFRNAIAFLERQVCVISDSDGEDSAHRP
jgi:hypothetical protein